MGKLMCERERNRQKGLQARISKDVCVFYLKIV